MTCLDLNIRPHRLTPLPDVVTTSAIAKELAISSRASFILPFILLLTSSALLPGWRVQI